jgi:hypothetical protein
MQFKPNQQQWTFIDNKSKQHRIMLVHSTKSGKLLIHYNYKTVILYDLDVFKSSKYSFFIDDELCEIHVIRNLQSYNYHFFVNKEANTPLNQARKKIDTRDKKYTWTFVIVLFTMVGIFVYFSRFLSEQRDRDRLELVYTNYGQNTTATIENINFPSVFYRFETIEGKIVQDKIEPCYMPWAKGDTFSLRYVFINPALHRIDTTHFDWVARQRMFENVRQIQQANHLDQDIVYINHLLNTAYELHGLEGWKHIYFQSLNSDNVPYNQNSYLRMVRDEAFLAKMKEKMK